MESKDVIKSLAALAQTTRLKIFRRLIEAGPSGAAVNEIASELGVAPATLSFHLKELTHADLITPRQAGRFIYYTANFAQMQAVTTYLTENCCTRAAACCMPPLAAAPTRTKTRVRRKTQP